MEVETNTPIKGGFWIGLGIALLLIDGPFLCFLLSGNYTPFGWNFFVISCVLTVLGAFSFLVSERFRKAAVGALVGTIVAFIVFLIVLLNYFGLPRC